MEFLPGLFQGSHVPMADDTEMLPWRFAISGYSTRFRARPFDGGVSNVNQQHGLYFLSGPQRDITGDDGLDTFPCLDQQPSFPVDAKCPA